MIYQSNKYVSSIENPGPHEDTNMFINRETQRDVATNQISPCGSLRQIKEQRVQQGDFWLVVMGYKRLLEITESLD